MNVDTRLAEVDLVNPTYLLVSGKDELLDVVPLNVGASVFVGAGSNCKVKLQDESVQQLHCMFLMGDNSVLKVQDWNTGATYLNGQLVSEETVMKSGDMVSVGSYCFTAVLDAEFHKGIAVELLCGDALEDPTETPEDSEVPAQAELGSDEQIQTDETDLANVVAGFNVGDEFSAEVDGEAEQFSKPGFKYDIDADLQDDGLSSSSAFDSLPADLGIAFGSDATGDDETSRLLMEVEQLRFELVDRESQILALKNDCDSAENTSAVDDSDTVKLVTRLEDLLVELRVSDDRIQSLEDLLRLSEDATAAETDERVQMEKWVSEIESRIGQRELESQAEVGRLVRQLEIAKDDTAVLQTQLRSVSVAGSDNDKHSEAIADLNKKVEHLRVSLQHANEKNQELLSRPVQSEDEVGLRVKLREAQDELATLRLQASQERAETARRRAELENMRAELERQAAQASSSCGGDNGGDSRIRAMREHLREIHELEQVTKAQQQAAGLGGRIAKLLSGLR